MTREAGGSIRVGRNILGVLLLVLVLVVFPCALLNPVHAADGHLDPSFGKGGVTSTDFSRGKDRAEAVLIQPDGKIVAAGSTQNTRSSNTDDTDFALARYNDDGSLDGAFGSGGKVTTDFSSGVDHALAIALQADGKIVAAGSAVSSGRSRFALARYNRDGSIDTGFGTAGKVTTEFGVAGDEGKAVAIQRDGKILVAGLCISRFRDYDFALARYNNDGSLDSSFGVAGKVTTDFQDNSNDVVWALVIQADDKIVAAGWSHLGGIQQSALVRYNLDGSVDPSFGLAGKSVVPNSYRGIYSIALQPDGKFVTAEYGETVSRYNTDGSLDTSFRTRSSGLIGRTVAVDRDGKILVGGARIDGATGLFEFAVVRYNDDGSFDSNFGVNGLVANHFSNGDDEVNALVIQKDGRFIAAGNVDGDFALARYMNGQDFSLGSSPSTLEVGRGTRARVDVIIYRTADLNGGITLTHSDSVSIGIKVMPDSVSNADSLTTFKLKIGAGAILGPQQITFIGKDEAGRERVIAVTLLVK